ncbi:MAG TPA: DUF488 family protein [Solirubrobacterales bacterium]|nr:DUF488 family protein [Solirubrobacterales bacterium]
MAFEIKAKRAYDPPQRGDGYRVLIDHIWPRGVSKERAKLDEWAKDLAPSSDLRRWFDHDPHRFREFRRRYRGELKRHAPKLAELRDQASKRPLTIVYAARDTEHNNAVVVVELLREG